MSINHYMQKISKLALIILGSALLWPQKIAAEVEFDPNNRINNELKLPDPEGGPRSVTIHIIQWALGLLGLAAVIMILIGGFLWMTARGNEEQVTKAKKTISSAVIGLIVITLAWALVVFIFKTTNKVTV